MKAINMLDSNGETRSRAGKNVLFHVLLAAVIVCSMAGGAAHAQYPFLLLDIGSSHNAAQIQEGFTAFTVDDSGTVVDGIKIEIEPMLEGEAIQARRRGGPTGIPYEQLYRDFIFTVNGGIRITLSQLEPNETYEITIYSWDQSSGEYHVADWFANEDLCLTTNWTNAPVPTAEDSYAFSGNATSDDTGTIILEAISSPLTSNPDQYFCFVNGIVVSTLTPFNKARRPVPEDGAVITTNEITLQWIPGYTSVSSNIYIGESFDDVNDATMADTDIFRGNSVEVSFPIGTAGNPYPDGLSELTTYYWRIDEVEEDGTENKGDIWSFSVASKSAFNPVPIDGSLFVDPNVTLSWNPGSGSVMHRMYFGDNLQDVQAGTGGTAKGPVSGTNYAPGILELNKTYYWRVDEFDGRMTQTGDIWSFTTSLPEMGTIIMDFWENVEGDHQLPNLLDDPRYPDNPTRSEALTEFGTADGVGDGYGAQIYGWLYCPVSGEYTFWLSSAGQGELWLSTDDDPANIVLLASETNWASYNTFPHKSDPVSLAAGEKYYIMARWKDFDSWDHCQVAWKGSGIPAQQIIQGSYLSPYEPVNAFGPIPSDGATDIKRTQVLGWKSGKRASLHHVYFGTDMEAVGNATTGSPEYKGTKEPGDESYDPGILELETTYYWRIDEVNNLDADSPWAGEVWSFTVGDYLLVDDFEDYNTGDNQIWWSWKDGLGYVAHGTEPAFPGNRTGSAVGDDTTNSFTEEIIVHGGGQSMPFWYDNNKQGYAYYSEARMELSSGNDWTAEGVKELSLWFRGYSASVGSFVEEPAGTYTMTASGTDITGQADEFHFAYKMISGPGSITAKVMSVSDTDPWAKAGVMIRETLEPGSKHALACVTPGSGVASEGRITTNDESYSANQADITAPHWVKLQRDISGNFTVSHSTDGTTWVPVTGAVVQGIQMAANVYVGLAVTSHNAAETCVARFSNVTITGNVTQQQWMNQDIGITSNEPESMYVVLNGTGMVYHDDPEASLIDQWTEWRIDLQAFAEQGVDLTNIDSIAIGIGTQGNVMTPGNSGKMYFDDIRLYRPGDVPQE